MDKGTEKTDDKTGTHLSESTKMSKSELMEQQRLKFWQGEPATKEAMVQHPDPLVADADRDEFLQYFPPLADTSVLELGAGIGRYTGELGQKARDVTVVDFMQRFLDVNQAAHTHLNNLTFMCADFNKLQLPQARFDVVVSGWMFVNMTRHESVMMIDKVLGWLRPGGYFIFRENGPGNREINKWLMGFYRSPLELQDLLRSVTRLDHTITIIRCGNSRAFITSKCDVTEVYFVAKKITVESLHSSLLPTIPSSARLPLTTIRIQDLKEAGVGPGSQVLVLGCGSGGLVIHVATTFGAVVLGLVSSMDAFNTALYHHRRLDPAIIRLIKFEMRATEDVEFKEGIFDVILVQESEFKIPNPLHLVARMKKWTKDGRGVFLIDQTTFTCHLPHIEAPRYVVIGYDDDDGEGDVDGENNVTDVKEK